MTEEKDLDEEFKQYVSDMKPHAKVLPYKSEERHRVTLWIKRLLALRTQKEQRNAHGKLLLQMLRSGKLGEPFTSTPPLGPLRPLPPTSLPHAGETELIMASSPLSTFSRPPLSLSLLLSQPSSSLYPATSRLNTGPRTYTPLKPTSGERNSNSRSSKTAAKLVGTEVHSSARERLSHHPTTPLLTSLPPKPAAAERQEAGSQDAPSHQFGSVRVWASKQVRISPGPEAGRVSTGAQSRSQSPQRKEEFSGRSVRTQTPLRREERLTEGSSRNSPALVELDFQPPLTSSAKGEGDARTRSVGVAWRSHDLGREHGEDYRPLSVCSDESSSASGDRPAVASQLQATPRPHPPASSSSTTTGGAKLSREVLQQRELELLLRSAETRHQEEKLRLQREHEDSVQQLLRRRSKEMQEVREESKAQLQQLQTRSKLLETTVAQLRKEQESRAGGEREKKEPLEAAQRPQLHQLRHQLQAEFDRKLHRTITDFERQKLDQEQRHAKHVQQVVSDCGNRIDQMERDRTSQISTSEAVLAELEGRVQELTQQNAALASEKDFAKKTSQSLEGELQAAYDGVGGLRKEVTVLQRERDEERSQAEAMMEARLREKERQHSLQEAKLLMEARELQQQLRQVQRTLEQTRENHRRAMAEKERKEAGLQSSLRLAESRLSRVREAQERQTQQAELAIEEFKSQVEQQSSEVFSSLHGQLERLGAELAECRAERDSSAQEWARERREEREKVNTQLQVMEASHQQEVEELQTQQNTQLETLKEKLEKAKDQEVSRLQRKTSDLQTQAKATASRNAKTVSVLEEKVQQLQQEVESQRARHSRDTARLRRRADEERKTASKMQEATVAGLKIEWCEEMKRMKQTHQKEIGTIRDKHNQRIQQLEHSAAAQSTKAAENNSSLQAQVRLLQADMARQECSHKERLAEVEHERDEDRASLTQHHQLMIQSIREEADASQQMAAQLQEQVLQLQQEHEAKVSALRLQFEATTRGMLPVTIRKEYEDTIHSLKSQVELLEQRRYLLQCELEQRGRGAAPIARGPRITATHSHTPSSVIVSS